jgi:hypothetical protein
MALLDTSGPVVLAYDGSDLAKLAIEEAGRQLAPGRDAVVVAVWQPVDVGFVPQCNLRFDAAQIADVRDAAEQTVVEGIELADAAGFRARGTRAPAVNRDGTQRCR